MMDYYKEMNGKMSASDKKMYGKYENQERAEQDVRSLMEAREIKADKKRHKMAMHCARAKKQEMDAIAEEGHNPHNPHNSHKSTY